MCLAAPRVGNIGASLVIKITEDLERNYKSIRFDFQKNLEVGREAMDNIFPND
jgi:hypothetical protein